MHRLICPNFNIADHINHNGLDNRKSNLRDANKQQNSFNTRSNRGSSIYKGVSFEKTTRLWRSYITKDGIRQYLGRFDNELDAALAYDKKAREIFGEYANCNI